MHDQVQGGPGSDEHLIAWFLWLQKRVADDPVWGEWTKTSVGNDSAPINNSSTLKQLGNKRGPILLDGNDNEDRSSPKSITVVEQFHHPHRSECSTLPEVQQHASLQNMLQSRKLRRDLLRCSSLTIAPAKVRQEVEDWNRWRRQNRDEHRAGTPNRGTGRGSPDLRSRRSRRSRSPRKDPRTYERRAGRYKS